jgi:excisionase family DNA binding protein
MSSNIKVQRICQYCGNEFTARTTVTQYCSNTCSKRAYKVRLRTSKVEQSNKETKRIKNQPIEELKAREFLTVTQVSKLIGCSRQNVYNLINTGKLKATNILLKKTIVKRSDLDKLFKEPINIPQTEQNQFDILDCYNLTEVQSKYGISEKTLQDIIKRNSIPKIKKGWFAYVPKTVIDKLLS